VRSDTAIPNLPQFPVDARGAPQRIRLGHLIDECPNSRSSARAARTSSGGA
jgi:hypothetical protein